MTEASTSSKSKKLSKIINRFFFFINFWIYIDVTIKKKRVRAYIWHVDGIAYWGAY